VFQPNVVYVLLIVVTVAGNLLVCVTISTDRKLRAALTGNTPTGSSNADRKLYTPTGSCVRPQTTSCCRWR